MSSVARIRRSRRISRKSPVQVADYDWQADALQLLLNTSHVDVTPSAHRLSPPSPSTCTASSNFNSPPSITTHLPFAPGSSHTRNRKRGHIPRPPNAFMVFRSWLWNKDNLKSIEKDNRNVSRIAGRYWNELSEAERAPFRCMAEEAKARHAQLYPEYKYSPGSQKKPKASQRRCQRTTDLETEKCKKVADLLLSGATGCDLAKYLNDDPKNVKNAKAETLEDVPEFVPTDKIPSLSLDACSDLTPKKKDDDFSCILPSHLEPGAHSVLGVKPEATSFAASCMLGTHTADLFALPAPVPYTEFDIDTYPMLVPFGSPVFSNPFDPSPSAAEHSAMLDTLDQLFGQPVSPFTSIYTYGN